MRKFLDVLYLLVLSTFGLYVLKDAITQALIAGIPAQARQNELLYLDFSKYYIFSKIALSSLRGHIFDAAVQQDFTHNILAGVDWHYNWFSEYPPYFGLAFAPFASLPLGWAYTAWILFSVLLALAGLLVVHRRLPGSTCVGTLSILSGLLASRPGLFAVLLGQENILNLGLFSFFCFLPAARHPVAKGALVALLAMKPHYALFAFCLLAGAREFKAIASFIAIMCAVACGCMVWFGVEPVVLYPFMVLGYQGTGSIGGHHIDVFRLVGTYSTSLESVLTGLPRSLSLGLNIALFVMAGLLCGRTCASGAKVKDRDQALAVSILAFLVLTPHGALHDCVLLALVAALTLPSTSLSFPGITSRVDAIWTALLVLAPPVSYLSLLGGDRQFILVFLYLLILLTVGLIRLRRQSVTAAV